MIAPFIKKLLSIFNQKEDILEAMEKLVEPIAEIVEEPAKAYENKYEKMVLKHSPFHEDTGFLPLVEKLIELNYELLGYEDDEDKTSIKDESGFIDMGKNIATYGRMAEESYHRMMEFVDEEQRYLEKLFRPTLIEISKRDDYKKVWTEHLSHFGNLLDLLGEDIKFFEILQKRIEEEEIRRNKPIVISNVIEFIKNNKFRDALNWVAYGRKNYYLTKEEFSFLKDIIRPVRKSDAAGLESLLSNKLTSMFTQDQANFLKGILTRLKAGIFATSLRKVSELKNKAQIKKEIIEAIKNENFKIASDLINDKVTRFLFSNVQLNFLARLVGSISENDVITFENLISDKIFSTIFDNKEKEFFKRLLAMKKLEMERSRIAEELKKLSPEGGALARMRQERGGGAGKAPEKTVIRREKEKKDEFSDRITSLIKQFIEVQEEAQKALNPEVLKSLDDGAKKEIKGVGRTYSVTKYELLGEVFYTSHETEGLLVGLKVVASDLGKLIQKEKFSAKDVLWALNRREKDVNSIIHAWTFWQAYFETDREGDFVNGFRVFGVEKQLDALCRTILEILFKSIKEFSKSIVESAISTEESKKDYSYYSKIDYKKFLEEFLKPAQPFDYYTTMYDGFLKCTKTYTGYNRGRSARLAAMARFDLSHIRKCLEGLNDKAIVDVEFFSIIDSDNDDKIIRIPMHCYIASNNQF